MKHKIYKFFITMTKRAFSKLSEYSVYQYTEEMREDPLLPNIVTILYAWTDDNNRYKDFKKQRKKYFFVEKDIFDDSKFKYYKHHNSFIELDWYSLAHFVDGKMSPVNILSTRAEMTAIDDPDYSETNCCYKLAECAKTDYIKFKDKFIMQLDGTGYTSIYDIYNGIDDNRAEVAEYNYSFGVGTNGVVMPFGNQSGPLHDEFNLFYDIYGSFFK